MSKLTCALVLALVACGGKSDPKTTPTSQPESGPVTINSTDDYNAKATAFYDQMIAMVHGVGTDCAKAASGFTQFVGDHRQTMDALDAYSHAHPGVDHALFDSGVAQRFQQAMDPLKPCANDKDFMAAMKKLFAGKVRE